MYHGSSSAACSGGNITLSSERTPWSTPAVSTRVRAARDEVVAACEFLTDVHPAFECGEMFVEPVHLHTMFDPLKHIVFFVDVGCDRVSCDFKLSAAHVVATVTLDFGEGCGMLKSARRLSQGVIGPPAGLEEFEEPVGECGSGLL